MSDTHEPPPDVPTGCDNKCGPHCRCVGCKNNGEHEVERQAAMSACLARDPNAFYRGLIHRNKVAQQKEKEQHEGVGEQPMGGQPPLHQQHAASPSMPNALPHTALSSPSVRSSHLSSEQREKTSLFTGFNSHIIRLQQEQGARGGATSAAPSSSVSPQLQQQQQQHQQDDAADQMNSDHKSTLVTSPVPPTLTSLETMIRSPNPGSAIPIARGAATAFGEAKSVPPPIVAFPSQSIITDPLGGTIEGDAPLPSNSLLDDDKADDDCGEGCDHHHHHHHHNAHGAKQLSSDGTSVVVLPSYPHDTGALPVPILKPQGLAERASSSSLSEVASPTHRFPSQFLVMGSSSTTTDPQTGQPRPQQPAPSKDALPPPAPRALVPPPDWFRGCGCKSSHCNKKYCFCLANGYLCTERCTCKSCKNGKKDAPKQGGRASRLSQSSTTAGGNADELSNTKSTGNHHDEEKSQQSSTNGPGSRRRHSAAQTPIEGSDRQTRSSAAAAASTTTSSVVSTHVSNYRHSRSSFPSSGSSTNSSGGGGGTSALSTPAPNYSNHYHAHTTPSQLQTPYASLGGHQHHTSQQLPQGSFQHGPTHGHPQYTPAPSSGNLSFVTTGPNANPNPPSNPFGLTTPAPHTTTNASSLVATPGPLTNHGPHHLANLTTTTANNPHAGQHPQMLSAAVTTATGATSHTPFSGIVSSPLFLGPSLLTANNAGGGTSSSAGQSAFVQSAISSGATAHLIGHQRHLHAFNPLTFGGHQTAGGSAGGLSGLPQNRSSIDSAGSNHNHTISNQAGVANPVFQGSTSTGGPQLLPSTVISALQPMPSSLPTNSSSSNNSGSSGGTGGGGGNDSLRPPSSQQSGSQLSTASAPTNATSNAPGDGSEQLVFSYPTSHEKFDTTPLPTPGADKTRVAMRPGSATITGHSSEQLKTLSSATHANRPRHSTAGSEGPSTITTKDAGRSNSASHQHSYQQYPVNHPAYHHFASMSPKLNAASLDAVTTTAVSSSGAPQPGVAPHPATPVPVSVPQGTTTATKPGQPLQLSTKHQSLLRTTIGDSSLFRLVNTAGVLASGQLLSSTPTLNTAGPSQGSALAAAAAAASSYQHRRALSLDANNMANTTTTEGQHTVQPMASANGKGTRSSIDANATINTSSSGGGGSRGASANLSPPDATSAEPNAVNTSYSTPAAVATEIIPPSPMSFNRLNQGHPPAQGGGAGRKPPSGFVHLLSSNQSTTTTLQQPPPQQMVHASASGDQQGTERPANWSPPPPVHPGSNIISMSTPLPNAPNPALHQQQLDVLTPNTTAKSGYPLAQQRQHHQQQMASPLPAPKTRLVLQGVRDPHTNNTTFSSFQASPVFISSSNPNMAGLKQTTTNNGQGGLTQNSSTSYPSNTNPKSPQARAGLSHPMHHHQGKPMGSQLAGAQTTSQPVPPTPVGAHTNGGSSAPPPQPFPSSSLHSSSSPPSAGDRTASREFTPHNLGDAIEHPGKRQRQAGSSQAALHDQQKTVLLLPPATPDPSTVTTMQHQK